eukprot:6201218-Pleurochrysis_carterae.AAC.1
MGSQPWLGMGHWAWRKVSCKVLRSSANESEGDTVKRAKQFEGGICSLPVLDFLDSRPGL